MRFGAHVNAHTSFDETVYQLQIPTDNPAVIDRALLILEDWAHNVSFDPVEIDKERGVILEEWRLGLGAGARMQDKQFPVLLKGSRYAERLPIGKPEILRSFTYDRLKKFYTDWYRPDLMAVDRGRRFRSRGRSKALIKARFGRDSRRGFAAAAAELHRARSAGDALHRGDRSRGHRHDGQRAQQDGRPRSVDDRRIPAVTSWSGCSAACCPPASRRSRRSPMPPFLAARRPSRGLFVRIGRSDLAQRAGHRGRHRTRPDRALHRGRSRRPLRLHRHRARPAEAEHAARARAGGRREGRARVAAAGRRIHPQLHRRASRFRASPTSTRCISDSCRRSRWPKSTPWPRTGCPIATASSGQRARREEGVTVPERDQAGGGHQGGERRAR